MGGVCPTTKLIKKQEYRPLTNTIPRKTSLPFPSLSHSVRSRSPLCDLSLVFCDHHHHADSKQQGQDLHYRLAKAGAAHQQFWEHCHCSDVDEAPSSERQDPGSCCSAHALGQQGASCASQSSKGR